MAPPLFLRSFTTPPSSPARSHSRATTVQPPSTPARSRSRSVRPKGETLGSNQKRVGLYQMPEGELLLESPEEAPPRHADPLYISCWTHYMPNRPVGVQFKPWASSHVVTTCFAMGTLPIPPPRVSQPSRLMPNGALGIFDHSWCPQWWDWTLPHLAFIPVMPWEKGIHPSAPGWWAGGRDTQAAALQIFPEPDHLFSVFGARCVNESAEKADRRFIACNEDLYYMRRHFDAALNEVSRLRTPSLNIKERALPDRATAVAHVTLSKLSARLPISKEEVEDNVEVLRRSILELRGYCEWMSFVYAARRKSEAGELAANVLGLPPMQYRGAFTDDPLVARLLHAARVPFYLVRSKAGLILEQKRSVPARKLPLHATQTWHEDRERASTSSSRLRDSAIIALGPTFQLHANHGADMLDGSDFDDMLAQYAAMYPQVKLLGLAAEEISKSSTKTGPPPPDVDFDTPLDDIGMASQDYEDVSMAMEPQASTPSKRPRDDDDEPEARKHSRGQAKSSKKNLSLSEQRAEWLRLHVLSERLKGDLHVWHLKKTQDGVTQRQQASTAPAAAPRWAPSLNPRAVRAGETVDSSAERASKIGAWARDVAKTSPGFFDILQVRRAVASCAAIPPVHIVYSSFRLYQWLRFRPLWFSRLMTEPCLVTDAGFVPNAWRGFLQLAELRSLHNKGLWPLPYSGGDSDAIDGDVLPHPFLGRSTWNPIETGRDKVDVVDLHGERFSCAEVEADVAAQGNIGALVLWELAELGWRCRFRELDAIFTQVKLDKEFGPQFYSDSKIMVQTVREAMHLAAWLTDSFCPTLEDAVDPLWQRSREQRARALRSHWEILTAWPFSEELASRVGGRSKDELDAASFWDALSDEALDIAQHEIMRFICQASIDQFALPPPLPNDLSPGHRAWWQYIALRRSARAIADVRSNNTLPLIVSRDITSNDIPPSEMITESDTFYTPPMSPCFQPSLPMPSLLLADEPLLASDQAVSDRDFEYFE